MTDIKIKRLSINNFKCHDHLTIDFDGRNTSIYGDNATGKTSIYDALTWLLFGKDSSGNGEKNIEIKPLDANGEVKDHDALTEVEAVLLVDSEEMTLRRNYREVWTTKRGSSESTYDGNTSEYYINGVPCKKNAFQDKVNELVSEDTFRMLTSVSHFASGISWQERREVLFRVAGVMDDRHILATNDAFSPLLESMGSLVLDDYKKKLLSEKKKFVGAKTEIPARISECQKTIEDIQGLDFAKARAEAEMLHAKADGISTRIVAIEHNSGADQKRMEIREVQLAISNLDAENKAYRDSQASGNVDLHHLNIRLTSLQTQIPSKKRSLENEKSYIDDLEKKIQDARKRWIRVNGEIFDGSVICPTCGQNLPPAQVQKARDAFEARKAEQLSDILQMANDYKASKAAAEDRLNRCEDEIAQVTAEMDDLKSQIDAAEASRVEPVDMDGYADKRALLTDRINSLSGELADMMADSAAVVNGLRKERADILSQISRQMEIANKESLLDYSRKRVEELREDAKNAAECLESIEKMLYLMEEYSRYKTRFVEDSINGLFRIARFRLFRAQANGGIEDRCDVVYDGVPYISVNNGMKINLGIDIINTLSAAYGVRVPLFVDNAESVTNLERCSSQIIRLVVSENDKELRVNYED